MTDEQVETLMKHNYYRELAARVSALTPEQRKDLKAYLEMLDREEQKGAEHERV